jgi:thymidylate kinase
LIIAVEGASCAGKTTLAAGLADRLGLEAIGCYYHVAEDPSVLGEPVARSESELLQALAAHLEIEQERHRQALAAAARDGGVILDRSVDTLLAHVQAISRIQGLNATSQARTMVTRRITAEAAAVPHLTLLLTAEPTVLARRAASRPGLPGIYYDPEFAAHFNDHFHEPVSPRCVRIRSDATAVEILELALAEVAMAGRE